jgi:hypothetical protein
MTAIQAIGKRLLLLTILLGLAAAMFSSPAMAQSVAKCGCYCGKVLDPPCSENACKQACGYRAPGGSASAQPSASYDNGAAAAAAEAERQRQEAERQRQEEALRRQEEERLQREAEERKRQQEEFERSKQQALRDMKGISDELGLKDVEDGDNFGLKGLGDTGTGSLGSGGLGLKEASAATTAPPPPLGQPAWDVQISDPQVAKFARSIGAIVPPPPVPREEVLDWKEVYLNEDTLMKSGDRLMAVWEMTGPLGSSVRAPLKVIMIGGKTFIAGENGAALYLVKKDQVYAQALGYLKNSTQSQQFARLVQAIRENRPVPASADPAMIEAARAIADPKLSNRSATVAWDAMISREALSAMFRKASIEIGSEYLSDKAGKLLTDENQRKAVFDSLRFERRQAVKTMELGSTTGAQREQLKIVIDHANRTLSEIYRVEKVADTLRGQVAGDATDKLANAFLGPEAKAPEPK